MPQLSAAVPVFRVTSAVEADAFYRDRLGFARVFPEGPPTDPGYAAFRRDAAVVHVSSHAGDGVVGSVALVPVDDVDALHHELVARGVAIALSPTDQTWGLREMYVRDPHGNTLRFAEAPRA